LLEFQNSFFEKELVKKDIQEIKIIKIKSNKLEIEQLKFLDD